MDGNGDFLSWRSGNERHCSKERSMNCIFRARLPCVREVGIWYSARLEMVVGRRATAVEDDREGEMCDSVKKAVGIYASCRNCCMVMDSSGMDVIE